MRLLLALAVLAFSSLAWAAPKASEEKALPYLGPGSDKLSKAEYERIYKNYIQTSILLGYPLLQGSPQACDQAVSTIFRQAGLFGYPVPGEATQVLRSSRKAGNSTIELYELGGVLIQLQKNSVTQAPERLFWVNSGAPKASRRLSEAAKKELLTLEKDKNTGLERVRGIPVGYPHMFLGNEGQGLLVKIVKFNGKKEGCEPVEYSDNAWSGGFDLSDSQCEILQGNVEKVWKQESSTSQFYQKELDRMKAAAVKDAIARGSKPAEAKKIVEKYFQPPFASEINVVGTAMRNLAQCNLMALGRASGVKRVGPAAPGNGQSGGSSMDAGESGSAK